MELTPQLRQLRDFYYRTALKLRPERHFVHVPKLVDKPTFFTLEHLKQHPNNPLLMPNWFTLFWQGKRVDCMPAVGHKVIQKTEVQFLNKGIVEDYLAHGASLILEGLDILDPMINAMCATIDAPHECVFSNAVTFFSQKGSEAYRGHFDTDDVLVMHLAGQKKWRIHERLPPRRIETDELTPPQMGPQQAEITMNPGDALYLRSGTPHVVETTGDYSLHLSFGHLRSPCQRRNRAPPFDAGIRARRHRDLHAECRRDRKAHDPCARRIIQAARRGAADDPEGELQAGACPDRLQPCRLPGSHHRPRPRSWGQLN